MSTYGCKKSRISAILFEKIFTNKMRLKTALFVHIKFTITYPLTNEHHGGKP